MAASAAGAAPSGRPFTSADRIVSVYMFHWFEPLGSPTPGQTRGVWHPIEGRASWDGSVAFWKRQVKDVMDAGVDLIYVHVIPYHVQSRGNFFQALYELRTAGYRVPQIAPWIDPAITYFNQCPDSNPCYDFADAAARDHFTQNFLTYFYEPYYAANPDPDAGSFLATMDGKPMMASWSLSSTSLENVAQFTREHLETRLSASGDPSFAGGVFFSCLGFQEGEVTDGFQWCDEVYGIFVGHAGQGVLLFPTSATVLPGAWSHRLDVSPEHFLARAGGATYGTAWNVVNGAAAVKRVHIESWNEYTEGTGIYEADPTQAYWEEEDYVQRDDTWGPGGRHYIDMTARRAATFNTVPALEGAFVTGALPPQVEPGASFSADLTVRNHGDAEWRGDTGFSLTLDWGGGGGLQRFPLDDDDHEIEQRCDPLFALHGGYGGVFRGRPITLNVTATAPAQVGDYTARWQMAHYGSPVVAGTVYDTLGIASYGGNRFAGDLGDPQRTADFICDHQGLGRAVFYGLADAQAGIPTAYKGEADSPHYGLVGNNGGAVKVIGQVACSAPGPPLPFGTVLELPVKVQQCRQPVTVTTVFETLQIGAYGGNYFAGDLGDAKRTADFICSRKGHAGSLSHQTSALPAGAVSAYKGVADSPNLGLIGNNGHGAQRIDQVVCNTCGVVVIPGTVYETLGIGAYGGNLFCGDVGDPQRTADFICTQKGFRRARFLRVGDKPVGAPPCAYKGESESPNLGLLGNVGHATKVLSEVQCSNVAE